MERNNFELVDNKLILSVEGTPLAIRVILIAFASISFIIPLTITILILMTNIEFNFGFVVSYFLFWGTGIYLVRVILWNNYGRELIEFGEDSIKYIADYRFFKDGKKVLVPVNVKLEPTDVFVDNRRESTIRILTESDFIQTALKINIENFRKLNEELKSLYKG